MELGEMEKRILYQTERFYFKDFWIWYPEAAKKWGDRVDKNSDL